MLFILVVEHPRISYRRHTNPIVLERILEKLCELLPSKCVLDTIGFPPLPFAAIA